MDSPRQALQSYAHVGVAKPGQPALNHVEKRCDGVSVPLVPALEHADDLDARLYILARRSRDGAIRQRFVLSDLSDDEVLEPIDMSPIVPDEL